MEPHPNVTVDVFVTHTIAGDYNHYYRQRQIKELVKFVNKKQPKQEVPGTLKPGNRGSKITVQESVDRHVDVDNLHRECAAPRPERPHHVFTYMPHRPTMLTRYAHKHAPIALFQSGGCGRERKTFRGSGSSRPYLQSSSPRFHTVTI